MTNRRGWAFVLAAAVLVPACKGFLGPDTQLAFINWMEVRVTGDSLTVRVVGQDGCSALDEIRTTTSGAAGGGTLVSLEARAEPESGVTCLIPVAFEAEQAFTGLQFPVMFEAENAFESARRTFVTVPAGQASGSLLAGGVVEVDTAAAGCAFYRRPEAQYRNRTPLAPSDSAGVIRELLFVRGAVTQQTGCGGHFVFTVTSRDVLVSP